MASSGYNPYNGKYYGPGKDPKSSTSSPSTSTPSQPSGTYKSDGSFTPSKPSTSSPNNSSGSSNKSGGSSGSSSPSIPSMPSQDWLDSLDKAVRDQYAKNGGNVSYTGGGSGVYVPPENRQQVPPVVPPMLPPMVDPYQQQYQDLLRQYQDLMRQQQQAPPTLSFNEAQSRAQSQLNPLYDQTLKQALQQVDRNNISRGFFGQLPGAALERSTAADIESRKAAAVGQMANQLVGQSESAAMSKQQLGLQQQQAQLQALLQGMQEARSQRMGDANIYQILRQLQMQQQGQDWNQKVQESAIRDMWYLD